MTADSVSASSGGPRLREAVPADAAALLALKERLDRETSFMLIEAGEREQTSDDVAADLQRVAATGNRVVIVAETEDGLVGYAEAIGGRFRRNRATASLVIGVLAAASGQGIGSGLMTAVETWAAAHGLHRLELTVMAHNSRARALYERMGFAVEGRRRECLFVGGSFADELYMAKLIPPAVQ